MTTINIPVHSIIDIITNSSSEIYTWANENAVETTSEMIKEMMISMGVEGEVSDYFDIELIIDSEWESNMRRIAKEMIGCGEEIDLEDLEEHITSGGYLHEELLCWDGTYEKGTRIKVTSKNGTSIDLQQMFSNIFTSKDCPTY